MKFEELATIVSNTHLHLQQGAVKAVNQIQTVRNWLIGFYIVEFEQNGEDRANYGGRLLSKLVERINIKGLSVTLLQQSRTFYKVYPQLGVTIRNFLYSQNYETLSHKSADGDEKLIYETLSHKLQIPDYQSNIDSIPSEKLFSSISFSHFIELMRIDNPVKRMYYEMLTIQTGLSVRELRRQIGSLSYERVGLSGDMENAIRSIEGKIHPQTVEDAVKDHRILKAHVLIELKVSSFDHAYAAQLQTYLNYYRANMMEPDDNPPIGILLVTNRNDALVQYATAGLTEQMFVSKYKLQLPSEQELKDLILRTIRE